MWIAELWSREWCANESFEPKIDIKDVKLAEDLNLVE